MKDFNIAKYLKEHNLGAHGILGKYIDLQALKEAEDGLGQQKAMPEPYEGPEDPIDGLGGKLNRDMDVSMNEMDGDDDVENAWMEYVDGTEAYKVGNWRCYYNHPGILVWLYKNVHPSKLAVYATPNWDGDETTPIQIEVNNAISDNMTLREAQFANFNEYAKAMMPYLNRIEDLESDWGSLAPTDESAVTEVSAFEERLKFYESEVNDLVDDMISQGASVDEVADFFQYISTKIRNNAVFEADPGLSEDDINLADLDTEDIGA